MVITLLLAGCSVVGIRSGTEQPKYDLVETQAAFEIRRYHPRIAIDTIVAADEEASRSEGFRRLAGYIFGNNHQQMRIAMTAPVAQTTATLAMTAPVAVERAASNDGTTGWRIRFFAPAALRMADMPTPNDATVTLVEVPGELYAVHRFTGSRAPDAVAAETARLRTALDGTQWRPIGQATAWFYDPPWTLPFLRRNEVAIAVEPAAAK